MPVVARVMRYGGHSYHEALALPTDVFAALNRCAYIERLQSTQEDREYLAQCERIAITTPDTDGLRRVFHIKEVNGDAGS